MEELKDLPEKIRTEEKTIWETAKEIEVLKREIDIKLVKKEDEILSEKDIVTNKAVYTNETARKNALKLWKYDDEEVKELLGKLDALSDVLSKAEIDYRYLKNLLKVLLVLTDKEDRD